MMRCRRFWLVGCLVTGATFGTGADDVIRGQVAEVAEGDCVTVRDDERDVCVWLHGIDCPEPGQAYGDRAARYTAGMVLRKTVVVDVVGSDAAGRVAGVVRTDDGRVVNHALLRAGLAMWWRQEAPSAKDLARLQAEAMLEKRGIWSETIPVPPWEFRRGQTGEQKVTIDPIEPDSEPVEVMFNDPAAAGPVRVLPRAQPRSERTRLIDMTPITSEHCGHRASVPQYPVPRKPASPFAWTAPRPLPVRPVIRTRVFFYRDTWGVRDGYTRRGLRNGARF